MAKFTEQDLQKAIEAGVFDEYNNTTATPATVIRFFEAWATERENKIKKDIRSLKDHGCEYGDYLVCLDEVINVIDTCK